MVDLIPTDVASVAGAHHERLDGSGYYRRALAASLPITSRLLAVANAFATSLEPRPHREALTLADAADALWARSPRELDPDPVDIYTRLGVSSRAPAALFAMEHNLLGPALR